MATYNGTEGNDTLIGGTAADDLNGFGGNDFLQGGDGADTVLGGSGNDTMSGNAGNDWVRGGTGNDSVSGGGGQDSFAFADFGAANADVLTDFAGGWDNIQLDLSAFTALGSTGRFGSGDARFRLGTAAQDADDRIIYNQATGQLWYDADGNGAGAAQLIATLANRSAMSATDIFVFQSATPPPPPPSGQTINGTPGNDTLVGTNGDDTINGLAGDDSLSGLDGNDILDGGTGTDMLSGGLGNDTFIGGEVIVDSGGIDTKIVFDGAGNLESDIENLTLRGTIGFAETSASGNDLDNVIRIEMSGNHGVWVDGLRGNDTLIGGDSTSEFFTFNSSTDYGLDSVDGGGSFDWLMFGSNSAVTVDFRSGTVTGGGATSASRVTFTNVEAAAGSDFGDLLIADDAGRRFLGQGGNDTFVGGAGNDDFSGDILFGAPSEPLGHDSMTGGAGNDSLSGDRGNDTLDGGTGNDFLRGGSDADVFRFAAAPGAGNADRLFDFETGIDEIRLDGRFMPALGASGEFSATDARFRAGTSAQDADDRIIYDAASGNIWYDADGNGAGAALLVATLESGTVVANDFAVENGGTTPPPGGTNGTEGNDTMTGTAGSDTMNGLGGNDFMQGAAGNDVMRGGAGNDTISGNDGADSIEGDAGNDRLTGGSGQDAFVFREYGAANADTLTDFGGNNWDSLRFDNAAYTGLGADGRFVSGDARFRAGAAAADADDRIVWNSAAGQVWYDADGSGAGAAQLVATLQAGATLVATDIWVI